MELTKEHFDEQIGKLAEDVSVLKTKVTGIEHTVGRIDKRDREDSDAFAKDIVQLQNDVKKLKLKQAI